MNAVNHASRMRIVQNLRSITLSAELDLLLDVIALCTVDSGSIIARPSRLPAADSAVEFE